MDGKELIELTAAVNALKNALEQSRHPSTPWLPLIGTAIGAVIGMLSGPLTGWLADMRSRKTDRKRATSALVAEVQGILTIARARRYRESMVQVIEAMGSGDLNAPFRFEVGIPSHYSRVYQASLEKLGALSIEDSSELIEFHQLIDAIVQDVAPGGSIAKDGGDLQAFEQMLELLDIAFGIGDRLVQRARQH